MEDVRIFLPMKANKSPKSNLSAEQNKAQADQGTQLLAASTPWLGFSGLDRLDLRILDALQRDGRMTNLKLADAVALSPTAVLARVQRLTRDGYILGYEARLSADKLGRGMTVFVEVLLDHTTPNVFDAFKAACQANDDILECHMVAGGFDYLLKTRMADMAAYRHFAGQVLWQLPGVRETRTYAVMEEVKNSTRLPLGV